MKYYHLAGLSVGIFAVQFFIENLLHLSMPRFVQYLFMGIQAILLGSYALLMIALLLVQAKQTPAQTNKQSSSTSTGMNQVNPKRMGSQEAEETENRWLKVG